jgi:hypothetical protein
VHRKPPRPDAFSLTAGLVLLAFGAILLLERAGELDLGFHVMAPIALAAVGAILLASGLSRRG